MDSLALFCLLIISFPWNAPAGQPGHTDAQLMAVLRSVTQAQTAYRASHGRYTASMTALRVERPPGVSVRLRAQGGAGFSAVASSGAGECAVYHGGAHAPRPWARTEGRIACRRR